MTAPSCVAKGKPRNFVFATVIGTNLAAGCVGHSAGRVARARARPMSERRTGRSVLPVLERDPKDRETRHERCSLRSERTSPLARGPVGRRAAAGPDAPTQAPSQALARLGPSRSRVSPVPYRADLAGSAVRLACTFCARPPYFWTGDAALPLRPALSESRKRSEHAVTAVAIAASPLRARRGAVHAAPHRVPPPSVTRGTALPAAADAAAAARCAAPRSRAATLFRTSPGTRARVLCHILHPPVRVPLLRGRPRG
jgi:hypothetical protein